jgi:hypothetical protein
MLHGLAVDKTFTQWVHRSDAFDEVLPLRCNGPCSAGCCERAAAHVTGILTRLSVPALDSLLLVC